MFAWLVFLSVACAVEGAPGPLSPHLELHPGDRIVIIGNTLAERMLYFGHFETLLHARFPKHQLVVRNLGWSADELTLRPRSKDFQDHGHTLFDHKPDVIIACFGFNESFAGRSGLPKFRRDLMRFIKETTSTKYNGEHPPQLVLLSPIANEDLPERGLTAGRDNNGNIALYTQAMREIAGPEGIVFVDLYTPTLKLMQQSSKRLTFNGIHLTDYGYRRLAEILEEELFGLPEESLARHIQRYVHELNDRAPILEGGRLRLNGDLFGPLPGQVRDNDYLTRLHAEVQEKNRQFFFDYRAVNGYYIYGGRKKPFGVVNFPAEFAKLRKMIAVRDRRIWAVAQGKKVPAEIDDSQTGTLPAIATNFKGTITITPPDEAIKKFKLPDGFEINLFASEEDFPDLKNPTQFAFDARGRLWVTTMPSYPMYLPGEPVNDKVLIFEDTDEDGRADKMTVFADHLHLPGGIELGDGGAYVAQMPNLLFLKDTDGDDRADYREIVLHGFDSADSHHAISAFEWGPGGGLYFQEGTFHHTQVETPYGPKRVRNAAVFRYEPRTEKFDIFVSYGFANPWGHVFDRWGQNFVADASGGANYYGTAFSGQVDYPRKHASMKQFLRKQWRPTCGCEIVSSRNFPDELQGNYLLNNCIGFLGTLQYRFRDEGSGFFADPVEPLLRSSDPNFRPVDLSFGPDGALYICDWFNPLIGHMQHSLRDPNRDKNHGRIWRIVYKNKPLVKKPKIAGQPIPALLDLLRAPENRTRYWARAELRLHDTAKVMADLEKWIARLDQKDPEYEHHLLEALWVCQHHDVVNEKLLRRLLRSPDYRARAAATRVLGYWRDRVSEPLKLLKAQVNDSHPRVRLEALRALSFFDTQEAQDVAVESLVHPQDYYLEYTFKETMATLDQRIKAKQKRAAAQSSGGGK